MRHHAWKAVVAGAAVIAAAVGAACESIERPLGVGSRDSLSAQDTNPALELKATKTTIYTGETVTLVAVTRNTLGRDARIEWFAPFGKLEQDAGGVKARLRVDRPGKVTVKASLVLGAQIIDDFITIEVRPLP